jgi:hypothetical protein
MDERDKTLADRFPDAFFRVFEPPGRLPLTIGVGLEERR